MAAMLTTVAAMETADKRAMAARIFQRMLTAMRAMNLGKGPTVNHTPATKIASMPRGDMISGPRKATRRPTTAKAPKSSSHLRLAISGTFTVGGLYAFFSLMRRKLRMLVTRALPDLI